MGSKSKEFIEEAERSQVRRLEELEEWTRASGVVKRGPFECDPKFWLKHGVASVGDPDGLALMLN